MRERVGDAERREKVRVEELEENIFIIKVWYKCDKISELTSLFIVNADHKMAMTNSIALLP